MKRFVLRTAKDSHALQSQGQVIVWCCPRAMPQRNEKVLVDGVVCLCVEIKPNLPHALMWAWLARRDA